MANSFPMRQIRRRIGKSEMADNFAIQPFIVIGKRHFINIANVTRQHHGRLPDITEKADFGALFGWQWMFGTAQQNIGLDAN